VVAGVNRIGSDSAIKVFELTDTVLAATAGWAFLQPQGSAMMRNISSLIEDFKTTIAGNAALLGDYGVKARRAGGPSAIEKSYRILNAA
jgi:hypothetical protein